MLFLRLAILSALSELVALGFAASSVAASSIFTPEDAGTDAFFAFSLAAEVLLARLVVVVLLTKPLPARLANEGNEPSCFSGSWEARAGTDECRRPLRATLARSVRGCAGLTGDDSLKSKIARSSFSVASRFTVGSLDPTVSAAGSSDVLAVKFVEALRLFVLVCSINAEMAFEVVD